MLAFLKPPVNRLNIWQWLYNSSALNVYVYHRNYLQSKLFYNVFHMDTSCYTSFNNVCRMSMHTAVVCNQATEATLPFL